MRHFLFVLLLSLVAPTVSAWAADEGPHTTPTHVIYCGINLGTSAIVRACFDIPPDGIDEGGNLYFLFDAPRDRQTVSLFEGTSGEFSSMQPVTVVFPVERGRGVAAFQATYRYHEGTYPGDGGYEPESFRATLSNGQTVDVPALDVN